MNEWNLTFGKYIGMPITAVYDMDPQYAQWLYTQDNKSSYPSMVREFLEDTFKDADVSYVMPWGKYKGLSLKEIKCKNPQYLQWLWTNDYVNQNCHDLKSAISELN